MVKEISKLSNGIDFIYKQNINTPRIALCLNFAVNKPDKIPGVYSLMSRLLVQGTKNYNSEQLANEFEKYAIDFTCDLFSNFLRIKFVCLNEDFSKALDLMCEVIENSTFEEFEKEKLKLKYEIPAELDSPRAVSSDSYFGKMFENHYYGNTLTKILENIDLISKEDVVAAYRDLIFNSNAALAVVGAIDKSEVSEKIENTLGRIRISSNSTFQITEPNLSEVKKVEIKKSEINQAQILKGWKVPTFGHKDYPALILLNIILGACGLSSRLFLELRDKKGLAYVVRSSYDTYKNTGNFMIYIATEPANIEVSLKGFDEEIQKIKTVLVSDKELSDAKNNLIGKCSFLEETNVQQACMYAKYAILGLGFDFAKQMKSDVEKVTPNDIIDCANRYFVDDKYVLSVVKP